MAAIATILGMTAAQFAAQYALTKMGDAGVAGATWGVRELYERLRAEKRVPSLVRTLDRLEAAPENEQARKDLGQAITALLEGRPELLGEFAQLLNEMRSGWTRGDACVTLTRFLTLRASGIATDVDRLNPYRQAIPLLGRDALLEELRAWRTQPEPVVSVRAFWGPAGSGKTRFALEACDDACMEGWDAGFLRKEELHRSLEQLDRWQWENHTLVVVDYAAAAAEDLRRWLAKVVANPYRDRRLRILLLERHADPRSGWWDTVFGERGWAEDDVPRLLDEEHPLAPLPALADVEDRRAIFDATLRIAKEDFTAPVPGEDPDFDRRIQEITWGGDPLFLMMAALLASQHGLKNLLELGRTDLARRIARAELERIDKFGYVNGTPHEARQALLRHLAAYATLCQGLAADEVEEVVKTERAALDRAGAGDAPDVIGALRDALDTRRRSEEGLAPASAPEQGRVEPILPDMVGEAVMLEVWEREPPATVRGTVDRALMRGSAPVVESIMRTAQDYASDECTAPLAWFEIVAEKGTADVALLAEIVGLLNVRAQQSIALQEHAAALSDRLVEAARRAVHETDTTQTRACLAQTLNNAGIRLGNIGRLEEALAATYEAADLSRKLAAARSNALHPDLAIILNNLGNCFESLGRREEALAASQEAVDIRRTLVDARPETFRPDLARALNNLGIRFSALGRREEALAASQEAVDIRRALAAARPDALRPDLAASMVNLSTMLEGLGRREEALTATREAVGLYRALAASQPDAFRPDLATALTNLGAMLNAHGRQEEALTVTQEAVDLCRALAAARPEVFRPDLARALNNLGNHLDVLGRKEEALAATYEAADLYRALAAARPDAFRLDLARALNNLGNRLEAFGHREKALAATQEATDLYRVLAAALPDAFRPDLSGGLNNLGLRFSALGRPEEALAATQEAVEIRRALAAQRPDAFRPDLAVSLGALTRARVGAGLEREALESITEAIDVLRPQFKQLPQAYSEWMLMMLKDYEQLCEKLSEEPDAELIGPIVEVLERMEEDGASSEATPSQAGESGIADD